MIRAAPIALAAAALLAAEAARAQAPAPLPDPKAVPEKIAPDSGSPTDRGRTGTLSDKLEDSEGVIKPGNPDPGLEVRPPDSAAKTPVIRPPGTSSSDVVRPK